MLSVQHDDHQKFMMNHLSQQHELKYKEVILLKKEKSINYFLIHVSVDTSKNVMMEEQEVSQLWYEN